MTKENVDSRTIHTDALETLGSIINETEKRDAIHLAVCPVVAQEKLLPGDHVSADGLRRNKGVKSVGIVDPFLEIYVNPGERFWLVIYPREISSLRHVWSHPAFPDEITGKDSKGKIEESKDWIRAHFDTSLADVLEAAEDFIELGEIIAFWGDNDNYDSEFWNHYEIVTGKKVNDSKKQKFFRCKC